MRPTYETEQDRAKEREALAAFCAHITRITPGASASFYQMPKHHQVDALVMFNSRLFRVVEVKCRDNRREQYPTLMIGVRKIMGAAEYSRYSNTPATLVVRWQDCIGAVGIPPYSMKDTWWIEIGGRTDRGDSADVEDCFHIPIDEFFVIQDGVRDWNGNMA